MDYAFMEEQISDEQVDEVIDVTPDEEEIVPQTETNEIAAIDAEMRALYNQQVSALYLLSQHTRAKLVLQRYGDSDILREMLGTTLDRSVVSTESFVAGLESIGGRILGTIWNAITAPYRKIGGYIAAVANILLSVSWTLEKLYNLYEKFTVIGDDILHTNIFLIDPPDVRATKLQAIQDCSAATNDAMAALKNLNSPEIPASVTRAMDSLSKVNFIKIGANNEIDWADAFQMLKKHRESSEVTALSASGYGNTWDECRNKLREEMKILLDSVNLKNSDLRKDAKELEAIARQTPQDSEMDESTAKQLIAKVNACSAVINGGSRLWFWYTYWNVVALNVRITKNFGTLDSVPTFILRTVMEVLRALGRMLKSVLG